MIYLAACALSSKIPNKETLLNMNMRCVYKMAALHSMQAITFMAVESAILNDKSILDSIDNEVFSKWKIAKAKAVRNNVLFDEERGKIIDFMENNGIWYSCLKGIVMQKYFSKLGMRQMGDNDILFDPSKRKVLHDFMLENDYKPIMYNKGYPDAYVKAPALNFEMHHSLYVEDEDSLIFHNYYKDVKNRLIKDENNDFGFYFSKEDFYIHSTTHAYKHFTNGGNGIRSLMDVFAFLSKEQDSLNFSYIEKELEKLGVLEFERIVKSLAFKLFSECNHLKVDNTILTEKEKEWLKFYLGSGTYGTEKNKIETKVQNLQKDNYSSKSKFVYVFRRIFPDLNYYKVNQPFLYKTKIFIPFFVVWRIFSRVIMNFKNIKYEIKTLFFKEEKLN